MFLELSCFDFIKKILFNKIKPKYYDNYIKLNQLFIIYYIFNTNSISKKIVSLIYLYRLSNLISILPSDILVGVGGLGREFGKK